MTRQAREFNVFLIRVFPLVSKKVVDSGAFLAQNTTSRVKIFLDNCHVLSRAAVRLTGGHSRGAPPTANMSFALNGTQISGGTFNNVSGNMTQVFNSNSVPIDALRGNDQSMAVCVRARPSGFRPANSPV
jgi:hypothetical protein